MVELKDKLIKPKLFISYSYLIQKLYLMMVLIELFEEFEQLIEELNMMVENKYLLLNYYKKQLEMMFDHYMLDNNMMLVAVDMVNKDQHKNPINMMMMNRVMDMMVDNNMMLAKNNMNPYFLNLDIIYNKRRN
jgi:hypothetical protein